MARTLFANAWEDMTALEMLVLLPLVTVTSSNSSILPRVFCAATLTNHTIGLSRRAGRGH